MNQEQAKAHQLQLRAVRGIKRTEQIPPQFPYIPNPPPAAQSWNGFIYVINGSPDASGYYPAYVSEFVSGNFRLRSDARVWGKGIHSLTLSSGTNYWARQSDYHLGLLGSSSIGSGLYSGLVQYPTYLTDDCCAGLNSGTTPLKSGDINETILKYIDWNLTYTKAFNLQNTNVFLASGSDAVVLNLSGSPKLTFMASGLSQVEGLLNIDSSGIGTQPDDGQFLIVQNRGSLEIDLNHLDPAQSGLNSQFLFPDQRDYTLYPNNALILEYDKVSGVWRPDSPCVAIPLASGGSTGLVPDTGTANADTDYLAADMTYRPSTSYPAFLGASIFDSSINPFLISGAGSILLLYSFKSYDTNSKFGVVSGQSRFTAPEPGFYQIGSELEWGVASGVGVYTLQLLKNSATIGKVQGVGISGNAPALAYSVPFYLISGDFVEAVASQTSQNGVNANNRTFWIHKIGFSG